MTKAELIEFRRKLKKAKDSWVHQYGKGGYVLSALSDHRIRADEQVIRWVMRPRTDNERAALFDNSIALVNKLIEECRE